MLSSYVTAKDRVLVIASVGMRNVGDEAILEGLILQLPRRDKVIAVSNDPSATRTLHHVQAVSSWAAPFALLRCNVLVISGGLFSGHMGPMQRLAPRFIQLATLLRVRCILYGIGIYSSTPQTIQEQLRRVIPRIKIITVRDASCINVVRQLGGDAQLVPDLASYISPSKPERAVEILQQEGIKLKRPLVALALTATGMESSEPLLEAFASVINDMPSIHFLFIPMCQHPSLESHNDLELAKALERRAPSLNILRGWYAPQDILAIYGLQDAVIGMRYHSLLFSLISNRPIIALPYSEKCNDFIQLHKLTKAEIDAEIIRAKLVELMGIGQ